MSSARRMGCVLGIVGLLGAHAIHAQAPLERRVSFRAVDMPLALLLTRLRHEQGIALSWRGDQVPERRVSVTATDLPLAAFLEVVLRGTGLEPRIAGGGVIVLVLPTTQVTTAELRAAEALAATGVQHLDQLVVTGSPVAPAPERGQPTAVTVVTQDDLQEAPHRRLLDQMRAFLPGIVIWDRGGVGPAPMLGAVRGVASFTARAPKVYVDGIEVASPELFTLLDGRMVRQLEMIHGPQGAALYGPDALNGVLQIETRKGRLGPTQVQSRAAALGGVHQRASDGSSLWREGAAGVEAGRPGSSGEALVSLSRLGDGVLPLADAWRVQGGGQGVIGTAFRVEGSARAAAYTGLQERGVPSDGRVALSPLEEQGAGLRLVHDVNTRFVQSLVAGVHRIAGSREPFRSPILPPRLPLGATNETATRSSLRWAGSLRLEPILISGGVEASHRTVRRAVRPNLESAGLSTLYHEALNSRGAFVQARAQFGALSVTAGARTERISSVGGSAERPWAAMAGMSWTTPIGSAVLRLRGAWGSALRAPEPGMSVALTAGSLRQEPNPSLLAERQAGVELGADLYLASSAWARVTWFSQRATDLIQQVDLRRPIGTTRFYQFQNVGAFRNRGVEADAGGQLAGFSAAVRVHVVSSRLAALSRTYSGEFEVGDAPLEVPRSSGALAVRHAVGRAHLEVGANWLGPWTGYDWQVIARVERGEVPARDRVRDYRIEYAGVVRSFVGVTVPIQRNLSLWLRGEAPLGHDVVLRDNLAPALGRTLLVGLELR